ncbi:MAG: hypothetical protein V4504_01480 [Patescibacteria group bacterium]
MSFVIMPYFSFTSTVEAQGNFYTTSGTYAGGSGGSSANLEGYIKGLAPAITQLPLCKKTLKNGTGNLFSKLKGNFDDNSKTKEVSPYQNEGAGLEGENSDAVNEANSVGVYDKSLNNAINTVKSNTEQIKSSTDSIDKNDTCLKSIGRMVTKLLLQKITVSTVNWINTGYEGKPTFLSNEDDFWGNIAKNEILQFGLEIDNEVLFPFGRGFMEAQALSFQNHFADNAQYSLDKLIADTNPQYSSTTFNADFSQGGWAAWDAMTQIPANNPLGFQLLASNELQLRLEGTAQSTAQGLRDDIQRGMGFMSQDVCVNPEGVTHEDNDAALAGDTTKSRCLEWKHVTPGSIIAETATNAVNYPNNQLLKSEDLNDAVAAILDAVINQWSTKLFSDTGFAGISNQGADGSYYHNTGAQVSYNTQVENDFPYANSTWLKENPDFNIRTGLTQALIDEQRIYTEKLAEQNDQLFVKVKTSQQAKELGLNPSKMVGKNYGLLPIIYQLDYCIPGPHPGFEEDAQASLDRTLSLGGIPIGQSGFDQALTWFSSVDPGGSNPTSASNTIGTIIKLFQGSDHDINKERESNANIIQHFAGVQLPATGSGNGNTPTDFDGVTRVLQTIVDGYIQVVHNIYSPAIMPDVTKEAKTEFEKTPGYVQMLENNTNNISSLKSVIVRLSQIKTEVDKLNLQLINHTITNSTGAIVPLANQNDQYEENLKPWISAFGRLTSEMVTGNDIAKVDNTTKQIKDKEVYIYNNLLKGPTGCEQDVQIWNPNRQFNLPGGIVNHKRYQYPLPIIYDYNIYPQGGLLPDPLPNPISTNPKSLFTVNNNRSQSFTDWNGTFGLNDAGYGSNPQNGVVPGGSVIKFCNDIKAITGIGGNCSIHEGPTFIHITNMVNIFQGPNGLDTLERNLGIY